MWVHCEYLLAHTTCSTAVVNEGHESLLVLLYVWFVLVLVVVAVVGVGVSVGVGWW